MWGFPHQPLVQEWFAGSQARDFLAKSALGKTWEESGSSLFWGVPVALSRVIMLHPQMKTFWPLSAWLICSLCTCYWHSLLYSANVFFPSSCPTAHMPWSHCWGLWPMTDTVLQTHSYEWLWWPLNDYPISQVYLFPIVGVSLPGLVTRKTTTKDRGPTWASPGILPGRCCLSLWQFHCHFLWPRLISWIDVVSSELNPWTGLNLDEDMRFIFFSLCEYVFLFTPVIII